MTTDPDALASIDCVIVDAVLGGRITAGTRLGEQALADIFSVSRTTVREALIRLETRGIVQVIPRRGWFTVRVSLEEAREAFAARLAVEIGILTVARAVPPGLIERLREHIQQECEAIAHNDVSARSFLAGAFHVRLAEGVGNRILGDFVRDLIARTLPLPTLQLASPDAQLAANEHEAITDAVADGDFGQAAALMRQHLQRSKAGVFGSLTDQTGFDLRAALMPVPKRPMDSATAPVS
jgi:DNA-binding GntR family transcriptional regulator